MRLLTDNEQTCLKSKEDALQKKVANSMAQNFYCFQSMNTLNSFILSNYSHFRVFFSGIKLDHLFWELTQVNICVSDDKMSILFNQEKRETSKASSKFIAENQLVLEQKYHNRNLNVLLCFCLLALLKQVNTWYEVSSACFCYWCNTHTKIMTKTHSNTQQPGLESSYQGCSPAIGFLL